MRSLIFSPKYPPYSGGASQYFPTLVDSLANDHDVYVITPYHPSEPLVSGEDDKLVYRTIPRFNRAPTILRMILETIIPFLFAVFIIVVHQIDIVHAHSTSYSTPAFGFAAVLTRTPILYDCRDENFPNWAIKIGDPSVLFSCAPNIDDEIIEAGFDREQIIRIPAINPEYVSRYEVDSPGQSNDDIFNIVFVGYLRPVKNVQLLIRAYSVFYESHSDSHLTIVGDGPLKGDVEQMVKNQGLQKSVSMIGSVEHETALEYIASADAIVLPSSSEGDPRVVNEAMQIGVPLIVTPVGVIPELLEDKVSAFLIEESAEAIEDGLKKLYTDPQFRKELAVNAKQASEDWDWNQLCEQVTLCYQSAVDN